MQPSLLPIHPAPAHVDSRRDVARRKTETDINDLNSDELQLIFDHLDVKDFSNLRRVSKDWRKETDASQRWSELASRFCVPAAAHQPSVRQAAIRAYTADVNLRAGRYCSRQTTPSQGRFVRMQWCPDGSKLGLVAGGFNEAKTARVVDARSGRLVEKLTLIGAERVSFSTELTHLLGGICPPASPGSHHNPLEKTWLLQATPFSPPGSSATRDAEQFSSKAWETARAMPLDMSESGVIIGRGEEGAVSIASLKTGEQIANILLPQNIAYAFSASPTGESVSVLSYAPKTAVGTLCTVYHVADGTRLASTSSLKIPPAWRPDGKMLAVLSEHNSVKLVDAVNGRVSDEPFSRGQVTAHNMTWSPNGASLVIEGIDGGADVMHLSQTGVQHVPIAVSRSNPRAAAANFCWSHDSMRLAGVVRDASNPFCVVRIIQADDGNIVRDFYVAHHHRPVILAWSLDGSKLAVGPAADRPETVAPSLPPCLKVFDAASFGPAAVESLATLDSSRPPLESLSWSPDGTLLAYASVNGEVSVVSFTGAD